MAQVAKEQLLQLFDHDRILWNVCYLSGSQSTKKYYHGVGVQSVNVSSSPVSACCNAVLDEIRETTFLPPRYVLFNTSFWGDFAQTLKLRLLGGLAWADTKSMSEDEVRAHLLQPLLHKIAHCASNMTVEVAESPSDI